MAKEPTVTTTDKLKDLISDADLYANYVLEDCPYSSGSKGRRNVLVLCNRLKEAVRVLDRI